MRERKVHGANTLFPKKKKNQKIKKSKKKKKCGTWSFVVKPKNSKNRDFCHIRACVCA